MRILVAAAGAVLIAEPDLPEPHAGLHLEGRKPDCLAADSAGRVWCGTFGQGVFLSEDGGRSWRESGLAGRHVTAVAASRDGSVVYAGTEPSAVFRTDDGGASWRELPGLLDLPSSSRWSFPPNPETHHVRWIAIDPRDPGTFHAAIEAGALVRSRDGGATWEDRRPGSPLDSHAIATHPAAPERLWSAAGDGWFESDDGGDTWRSPEEGLDDGYLWGVAVDRGDPDVVLVSGAQGPYAAHQPRSAESRVYRREGREPWRRVSAGLPDPRGTTAPLLAADAERPGVFWAVCNRGVFVSEDAGASWRDAAIPWPDRFTRHRPHALAVLSG